MNKQTIVGNMFFKIRLVLLVIMLSGTAYSFQYVSDSGTTGLIVNPSGRVLDYKKFNIGLSYSFPYKFYYVNLSPHKKFEITGRISEIMSDQPDGENWEDYGNIKDKYIAIKYNLLEESKYLPSISIGLEDPHGTKMFGGQYVAMSKEIYPFDFTVGYGFGRYGTKALQDYSKKQILRNYFDPYRIKDEANFFFGFEMELRKNLNFIYEYNPIDYEKQTTDPAYSYFRDESPVKSKHNVGVRYKFYRGMTLTASYQRGNTYGISIQLPFEIGEPVLPMYNSERGLPDKIKDAKDETRMKLALIMNTFSPSGVNIVNRVAYVETENKKYFFERDGINYAISALSKAGDLDIDKVVVVVKNNGVPTYSYEFKYVLLDLYREGKIDFKELNKHVKVSRAYLNVNATNTSERTDWYIGYKPQFNFFFNDPSGFFKGSIGIRGWAGKFITRNMSAIVGIAYYPINTVSTVNDPMSRPVRTDTSEYIDKKYIFEMAMLNYTNRIPNTNIYFNSEIGFLESMYAGVHGEFATHFFKDRLMIGVSSHIVKKRDKDFFYKIDENSKKYDTHFLKIRFTSKRLGGYIETHFGKFLAGDKGAKVILTKNIKGVLLKAWYTKTNTEVFDDEHNRGYADKGIMITVPIRLFKGQDSKSSYAQSISPWTRDVGAQVGEYTNLFDYIGHSPHELR
jgi:hypothetical protein